MQSYHEASKQKVLIVDDDPFISETMSMVFRQHGFDTRIAYSAELALKLVQNWRPELAILDVHLSKMNGVDLATRIRDEYPLCKILLFSGVPANDPLIEEAEQLGLNCAYLRKPAHPETLVTTARELLHPSRQSA